MKNEPQATNVWYSKIHISCALPWAQYEYACIECLSFYGCGVLESKWSCQSPFNKEVLRLANSHWMILINQAIFQMIKYRYVKIHTVFFSSPLFSFWNFMVFDIAIWLLNYRIGLNTAPLLNRTHPLRIQARIKFLCVFYVTIRGQISIMKNRPPGLYSSQYGMCKW